MSKSQEIWNCPTLQLPLLSYKCPAAWNQLHQSDNPDVRNCSACQKQVHLCRTPQEFVQAAEEGHCVAIPDALRPIHLCAIQVGEPSAESAAEFKSQLGEIVAWWSAVIAAVPESLGDQLETMKERVDRRRDDI